MHQTFSTHPNETADTEHHQPPPTQGAPDRSTKRMFPHTKVVRLLKMSLECHRGKKIISGKISAVRHSQVRFTKKVQ